MNPAALLKAAPWLLAGVVAIALGVQTVRLANRDADLAGEKLAFADFKKETAVKSLQVVNQQVLKSDQALADLGTKVENLQLVGGQVRTEIRYVKSDGGPCATDPAYLAWIDGVQRISAARRGAGGGAGQTVKGPADKVPGARAASPK